MLPRYATMANFGAVVSLAIAAPVFAHKVQTAADVGATLHIEPNDNPRAGESSLTWFALTRKGGQIIRLTECDCQLAVYSQLTDSQPLLEPPLKAISAERYQNIPAAEIVFPQPSAYRLQFTGFPKVAGSFQPFELNYDINVAPGVAPSPSSTVVQLPSQPQLAENQWLMPAIASTFVILGLILAVWRLSARKPR
ncbi:hypothetical protein [Gloeocapsopsis dulcis]|uniref:Transketolase n=1 Tax=Gloeocapsopsis dulcis AAB1 = 1H9 TaxID=1433147 RepID=A0A6N8G3S8_9CHRO|nr:hypothetical protein [Gloeocapsopsis dulcis]MUL39494.1 hypothetical protein [Gloeocapsopsis dulcis AAB1 = 1H9]WNN87296.1 hypothetical protein P0S91_13205 [Gloeocapsopsis dulcis]